MTRVKHVRGRSGGGGRVYGEVMVDAPHAPWALRGEVLVGWARIDRAGRDAVPVGLQPLPGPAAITAVRYTTSPVGPFLELSVVQPSRLGLRPGLCVTAMVVSQANAQAGHRLNWGLPAEVGRLTWAVDGDERVLRWDDGGVTVRAVPVGPRLPLVLPVRSVQRRGDGPVIVPRRVAALVRPARTTVELDGDDHPWAWLAGPHPGAVSAAARLLLRPARHPSGLLSSFRAPLRAPEPLVS